jgi:enhancing lycopene biosynthesis protein 2
MNKISSTGGKKHMKKACVLFSGCGCRDGTEIHESVLSLLSLDNHQIQYQCIGLDIPQATVIDHWRSLPEKSSRNSIVEAARIARGKITPIEEADISDADFLIIPGGLGAATTLCTYAKQKENAVVLPAVQQLVLSFFTAKKPIVAICISPALVALCLKNKTVLRLTLGTNPSDLDWLSRMGMVPISCSSDSWVVDADHRIISTPAYMEQTTIAKVWKGIDGAINAACSL